MQTRISQVPVGGDAALLLNEISTPAAPWQAFVARVVAAFRRRTHDRTLAGLSDRQLRDAGIDLSLARRGPAIAARPDPNLEGLR